MTEATFTCRVLDSTSLDQYLCGIFYAKARLIVQELLWTSQNQENNNNNNNNNNDAEFSPRVWALRFLQKYHSWLLFPWIQFMYIWSTKGQTPATRALGLEVVQNKKQGQERTTTTTTSPSSASLMFMALSSSLLPLLYDKLVDWIQTNEHEQHSADTTLVTTTRSEELDTRSRIRQQRLAQQRQLETARTIRKITDRFLPMFRLFLFLRCWMTTGTQQETTPRGGNGDLHPSVLTRRSTTNPIMWISGLAFTTSQATDTSKSQREASPAIQLQVAFAHRRFLWEEMARTLRLWLVDGLCHLSVWRTLLLRVRLGSFARRTGLLQTPPLSPPPPQQQQQQERCPVCHAYPIVVPMKISCCGQWYCYTCLYDIQGQICCHVCGQANVASRIQS